MEDPTRAKDLNDKELPTWTKSNTEAADPKRANDRNDKELPTCTKSITDML
jgi:hypothetical protein